MTPKPQEAGCHPAHSESASAPSSTPGPGGALRADQRQSWLRGQRVRVEDYLKWTPAIRNDAETILDLVYGEYLLREELGENPKPEEYLQRFPHFADALRRQFRLHELLRGESGFCEPDS